MDEDTSVTTDEEIVEEVKDGDLPMTTAEIEAELDVLLARLGADKLRLVVEKGDDEFEFEYPADEGDEDGGDDGEPLAVAAE